MVSTRQYAQPLVRSFRSQPALATMVAVVLGVSYVAADEGGADAPKVMSVEAQLLQEKAAIAVIEALGGWVKTETIGDHEFVVEVNMAYHTSEGGQRLDNKIVTDQANQRTILH